MPKQQSLEELLYSTVTVGQLLRMLLKQTQAAAAFRGSRRDAQTAQYVDNVVDAMREYAWYESPAAQLPSQDPQSLKTMVVIDGWSRERAGTTDDIEIDKAVAVSHPDYTPDQIPYPAWVCESCGRKYGNLLPQVACYHTDICGVCGETAVVTEPRDYGHLREGWQQHARQP